MKRNPIAWAALILSAAALASSWGVSRPLPAAPKVTPETQKTVQALSQAFEAVADFVKPSVVQISIQRKAGALNLPRGPRRMPFPGPNGPQGLDPKEFEEMLKRFFGPNFQPEPQQFGGPREGTGSGFVYDDQGHILTNNHVVENAQKITVTFFDGTEATAKIVGVDPQSDVAVIKVDTTDFRALPRGRSGGLKVGEWVMAVGSPFGLSHSVTTGIISATDRNSVGINDYESFLQTDAAINPGNSGGPLVNMSGSVVGINSAIVTQNRGNDGVGFAIPIDMASVIADNLIKNGKVSRSRVGIVLGPLSPVLARQLGLDAKVKGVMVSDVLAGSPADKAGLKSGDVITGFDGNPVVNVPTFRLTVAASEAGKKFRVKYWRDGEERETTIVPAPSEEVVFEQERPQVAPREEKPEPEKTEIGSFGLEVQPLTPELAAQFGYPKDAKGLIVSDVKDGGPAAEAGLEPGLLISRVVKDRRVRAITTVKEFQALVDSADDIAFHVETPRGQGRFVTLSKTKKN